MEGEIWLNLPVFKLPEMTSNSDMKRPTFLSNTLMLLGYYDLYFKFSKRGELFYSATQSSVPEIFHLQRYGCVVDLYFV